MQKIFRIRNSSGYDNDINIVNEFVGGQGTIVSVTASRPIDKDHEIGSWLIVADNGKEYKPTDPLE